MTSPNTHDAIRWLNYLLGQPIDTEPVDTITAERDALRAEVESLRADAERYRWMLLNATHIDIGPGYAVLYTMRGGWHTASLTAAIDAARAAQEGKT